MESEREYNQRLEDETLPNGQEGDVSDSPFQVIHAAEVLGNCSGVVPTSGLDNRRGLPARYTTPIRVYPTIVRCGSYAHVNDDTYAADISVVVGTDVYATTQNEQILEVYNTYSGLGYGRHVRTYALQYVRGAWESFPNRHSFICEAA